MKMTIRDSKCAVRMGSNISKALKTSSGVRCSSWTPPIQYGIGNGYQKIKNSQLLSGYYNRHHL